MLNKDVYCMQVNSEYTIFKWIRKVVQILLKICWEDLQKQLLYSDYIFLWQLDPACKFLHNIKRVTSDKVQKSEREKKLNWKHPQGIVISINEVWHHIFKYPEVITNLNFVMIQKTQLDTIIGKSLQNTDNLTNNNFTQSDTNVTNNSRKIFRSPNELRKYLSNHRHFS